ncbi:unnamed protein product [Linum trigynum]|uniref:Uncharacterized protein n=1 Tax=Linum trigynum TaxID=586398 RepID=A0AAV2FQM8_9ROSI
MVAPRGGDRRDILHQGKSRPFLMQYRLARVSTSTSYIFYKSFPPNFDALFEKDPFEGSLCQDEAEASSIPLGGSGDDPSRMLVLVRGKEKQRKFEESFIGGV